jgi:two-component system CheB/CheR fusion protein
MDAKVTKDEQTIKMLSKMDYQIVKLTSLINDLLDTSKLQSGTLTFQQEFFQPKKLITDTIEKIKPTAPDQEFVFKSNTDAYVNADRERIGQVIINFLSNAVKYGGSSKKINIELNEKDNKIICSVEDFGKGIIPEEQDKVFGRFYRISGKNMNTFPGLGLGLFISKEIIENHGGKIGVTSEKDKGSVFYFELPINEAPSQTE